MKKLTLLLTLFMLLSLSANAQFCNDYADKAVSQYKLAKDQNIPDTDGLGWSEDWNAHYNWCTTVPQDIARNENVKRQKVIDAFLNANQQTNKQDPNAVSVYKTIEVTPSPDMTHLIGFKDRISDHYAKESVRQNKENISNNCGFKGPSWSSDYNAHKNWCLHGDNYLQVDKILAGREKLLKKCSGSSNNSKVAGAVHRIEPGSIKIENNFFFNL